MDAIADVLRQAGIPDPVGRCPLCKENPSRRDILCEDCDQSLKA